MRQLATVQLVRDIQPIPKADFLEVASVLGWKVVIRKDDYRMGEKVIYCEVDSFLPIRPEFEFLRQSSYRLTADGREGFRLKTIKLRGQISQGLLLPLNIIKNGKQYEVGDDVTDELGISLFEVSIESMNSDASGAFPEFLPKTDQERIQNLPDITQDLIGATLYASEKLDGMSATYYLENEHFGICSRNWELKPHSGAWGEMAAKYDLEARMREVGKDGVAIQGEIVGPGIQGNKYKLNERKLFLFGAFFKNALGYWEDNSLATLRDIASALNVPLVPQIGSIYVDSPLPVDYFLDQAAGKSALNPLTEREGLVFRTMGRHTSFKAISNRFLLKNDE